MEIWRRCGQQWPEGIVLYVESMAFTESEILSFKEIVGHIEMWLKDEDIYDSEGEDSDEEGCQCHIATRDLMLPCGNHLE